MGLSAIHINQGASLRRAFLLGILLVFGLMLSSAPLPPPACVQLQTNRKTCTQVSNLPTGGSAKGYCITSQLLKQSVTIPNALFITLPPRCLANQAPIVVSALRVLTEELYQKEVRSLPHSGPCVCVILTHRTTQHCHPILYLTCAAQNW